MTRAPLKRRFVLGAFALLSCSLAFALKTRNSGMESLSTADQRLLTLAAMRIVPNYADHNLVIVLAETTGTKKNKGLLWIGSGSDKVTSPLLAALRQRNSKPFVMQTPLESGRIVIAGEGWAHERNEKAAEDTAYVMMWLPGLSPDGQEAVVYAWTWYESNGFGDGRGVYHYYVKSQQGWMFVGEAEAWIT